MPRNTSNLTVNGESIVAMANVLLSYKVAQEQRQARIGFPYVQKRIDRISSVTTVGRLAMTHSLSLYLALTNGKTKIL